MFNFWVENDVYSNFENFFKIYEDTISSDTNSLIEKILSGNNDCKKELRNIICGKMMNYFRNPFCINEHLPTLKDAFDRLHPTNEELYSYFIKIDNTNTETTKICSYLGVSNEDYLDWMKIIFIIFSISCDDKGTNLLEC